MFGEVAAGVMGTGVGVAIRAAAAKCALAVGVGQALDVLWQLPSPDMRRFAADVQARSVTGLQRTGRKGGRIWLTAQG